MEFKSVLEMRRSIRKYKDSKVDETILKEAIKYGIMAPSAHNRQPWKIRIATTEEKNRIADELYNKTKDIEGHTGPNTAGIIREVPSLLVVFIDNQVKENRDHDVLSIGAFIENIILYLTDIGLGTLWIANTDNIKEEIKKVLNTDLECVSCIGVGEKDQDPHMRPRKEIDDILI
jgi:nitroreductase